MAGMMSVYSFPREAPLYADPQRHARASDILRRHSTNPRDVWEFAIDLVPLDQVRAVLELGCGFGGFAAALAPRLRPGTRYVGVDANEQNRDAFLARTRTAAVAASFVATRLPCRLDLPSGGFDLVVASYSFYFFPDMLHEVHRLLRPGGVFLALTHSVRNLGELYAWFDSEANIPPILEIIHRFSAENGETLLRTRFEQVRTIPFPNRLRFAADEIDELIEYLYWKRPVWEGHCDPDRVVRGIREVAARTGEFTLNKDDAIFVARKGGPEPIRYCSACGQETRAVEVEGRVRRVCGACGKVHYVNPLPAAAAIVGNDRREVLLVRRAREPHKGEWCLPVGFAEVGETIAEAAVRELCEEAGVRGEVLRLVDAGSVEDSFYGDLLIVTFEVRVLAGEPRAGDDAEEVRWFPATDPPPLAFEAQQRALARYVEQHADEWRVLDSVWAMARRNGSEPTEGVKPDALLSDDLLAMLEHDRDHVIALWIQDVRTNPATPAYRNIAPELLAQRGGHVLGSFGEWIRGDLPRAVFDARFRALGRARREQGVPLRELVASFVLFKKHLWLHGLSKGVWQSATDVVRLLEMDRRVAAFFDHAIYHAVEAYDTDR